jgi:hypothetical protein
MEALTFRALLYRYWFYDWLFRDASRGTLLERSSALRYNRQQARWLPTYLRRMTVLGLICYAMAAFIEVALDAPRMSAPFYVTTALTVPYNVVTGVCWWVLTQRQGG